MKPFRYVNAGSLAEASTILRDEPTNASIIAGGTDLLEQIKEGTVRLETLVNLSGGAGLDKMTFTSEGIQIGALVTVAELEVRPEISQKYPALAEAAASVATPQIRNVGTVGGNLCQRPRCWYYRSPLYYCAKKGGPDCFAYGDNNKYHAIFGGSSCHIVHPSDLAVAMISLRAEVSIQSVGGVRTMPLEEFFATPDQNIRVENVLQPGEILTEISIPAASSNQRSVFLKAKERPAMDFALCSVALVAEVSDGIVNNARVTLGAVAPIPWRVRHVEDALNGKPVGEIDAEAIGALAVRDARPLKDNAYKVRLTQGLVRKAVRTLFIE